MTVARICLSSAYYPPHMGGVEVFTQSLARELSSRDVDVTVVTDAVAGDSGVTRDGNMQVYRMPAADPSGRFPALLGTREARDLWERLTQQPFDGIVVNTRFYPISLRMFELARAQGTRPVLIEHGSSYLSIGNKQVDQAIRAYEDGIARIVRNADPRCYGVSAEAASWLGNFLLVPDGVIHNAIDAAAFRAQASGRDFRAEAGAGATTCIVAFTGRLIVEKGVWTLVEAARQLVDEDIRFLVAGEGPELDRLRANAPANMRLLGRLDRPDVAALLAQADAFCFPSVYPEGLPTSLLEAAACGAYIVTAPVAGAREVVPGEVFGTVLHAAQPAAVREALERVLRDPIAAREAAQNCRDYVEREFTWAKSADAVMQACGLPAHAV